MPWLFLLCLGCYQAVAPSRARETERAEPAPPPPDPTLPRVRRLSIREVRSAYADLLNENVDASAFLPEQSAMRFDNGASTATVQTDQAACFETVAWRAAENVIARREPRVLAGCDVAAGEFEKCRDVILERLAPRVYRRPLTIEERERLVNVFANAGLEGLIASIMLSPAFLYREEVGAPTATGDVRLGAYEIASALSFFVAGTTPDDALLAAAAKGELANAPSRRAHAERLLATPNARRHWRTFLRQWLALEEMADVTKAPPYELKPALRTAMSDEIDRVIDDVLGASGSLDELFSTTRGYTNDTLGAVYGMNDPSSLTQRVELDAITRSGILTRAGWLATHAAPDSSSPIARGVFVLSALVCRPPPPPPPGISRVAFGTPETKTTRQRFAAHTNNPNCQGCHASIDGAGFGFESFDAMGAFRTTEQDEPVDPSGVIDLDGTSVHFSGPSELSRYLRVSGDFRACFLRQVFRFAMGAPESDHTFDAWSTSAASFAIGNRIDALALTMVESEAFVTRRREP